jgi:hypothetical protein
MQLSMPTGVSFDIADEWWMCADMDKFLISSNRFYPCWPNSEVQTQIVPLPEIEPPTRNHGVPSVQEIQAHSNLIRLPITRVTVASS